MRTLLMMEYEEEKRQFSEATEKIGMTRIVERGNAWLPLSIGRTYWNSLNQRMLEVFRHSEDNSDNTTEERDHNFEYGRQVSIFTYDKEGDTRPHIRFGATVGIVDGNRMALAIPNRPM